MIVEDLQHWKSYVLTPWRSVIENLIVAQIVNTFADYYGTMVHKSPHEASYWGGGGQYELHFVCSATSMFSFTALFHT
jgi:hypothetical protein